MTIKELKKLLTKELILSKEVFLIGHNNIDLDALASMAGFSLLAKKYRNKVYLIIDDKDIEKASKEAIDKISTKINIIKSNQIKNLLTNRSILIIFDTNKQSRISIANSINKFKTVIVIDHHTKTKDAVETENLYIDEKATSTCEIIASLLYKFRVKVPKSFATILLGGIVLDTNNFMYKMTRKSFFYCYYLSTKKADINEAQMYLKQDIEEYINRSKIIANTETYGKIVIAKGKKGKIYKPQELAKTAALLLEFKGIETSFAIGHLDRNLVGISARSLKEVNVGKLMEKFGGGGSKNEAAAQIENISIKQIEETIKKLI